MRQLFLFLFQFHRFFFFIWDQIAWSWTNDFVNERADVCFACTELHFMHNLRIEKKVRNLFVVWLPFHSHLWSRLRFTHNVFRKYRKKNPQVDLFFRLFRLRLTRSHYCFWCWQRLWLIQRALFIVSICIRDYYCLWSTVTYTVCGELERRRFLCDFFCRSLVFSAMNEFGRMTWAEHKHKDTDTQHDIHKITQIVEIKPFMWFLLLLERKILFQRVFIFNTDNEINKLKT